MKRLTQEEEIRSRCEGHKLSWAMEGFKHPENSIVTIGKLDENINIFISKIDGDIPHFHFKTKDGRIGSISLEDNYNYIDYFPHGAYINFLKAEELEKLNIFMKSNYKKMCETWNSYSKKKIIIKEEIPNFLHIQYDFKVSEDMSKLWLLKQYISENHISEEEINNSPKYKWIYDCLN